MKFGKINHLSTRLFLIIIGTILPFLILLIYNAEIERETTIEGQHLYIAVGIPLTDFEIAGNQIFIRDLMFCGLALILSLIAYRFISNRLVIRVIQPIILATRRLRDGDLSARVHAPPDDTDLGRLAQTFDEMADTLERRSKELEQDIASRKQAEEELFLANQKLHMVLDNMTDAYIAWDKDWKFLEINASAKQGLYDGRPVEELLGKVLWEVYPQSLEPEFYQQCLRASRQDYPVHFEVKATKTGEWWEVHAYPSPEKFEIYLRDITDHKLNEALMQELAFHDPLTGLLNRNAFKEEMQRLHARVKRNGHRIAIFYIDLDHFKNINDQYDHDAGDNILKVVAARIQGVIRPEDIFSRIGGDEFILLIEINEVEEANFIAERIKNGFTDPVTIKGTTVQLSLSTGISIYPDDSYDLEKLIQMADHAMYRNKRNSKQQLFTRWPV